VNIFEVPVYVENLKLNNKSILQYCKKLNKDDVGETVSNIGGWHSSNIKDAHIKLQNLYNQITEKANIFAKKIGKKNQIKIDKIWININKYKDYNQTHFHPHCFLSGVYYVNVFDKGGSIVFDNPAQDLIVNNWKNDMSNFNTVNSCVYRLIPNVGDLILFPSWLKHRVEPNMTNKERVSISFNLS
jgi:uncharacterized protein (TIGR02466 family)|tara:strand:+ start:372 stop:929 length:558 start_codon:yes stop_codon:yes gene_type:complete